MTDDLAFRATLDVGGYVSGASQIQRANHGIVSQLGSLSTGFGGLASTLGSISAPMAAVAGAATVLGSGLAAAVRVAGDFQSSMSRVASVSGANAQELKQMSDAAREAGATTVFSASQAADAMYFLASSGMSASQQMAALPETLNLASAGSLELAKAAEIVTNTLSQYNLAAEDTGRVSNVLAAASAATNTDVTQLGAAMQNVGPMAATLGMSIEDTAAAMGIFANSGVKGAEAGTALKSMLGSLLGPSKTSAAALAEMGLSVEDVNPSLHSYDDIMTTLNENHMTAAQSVAIFGKEMASNAMIAVNGAGKFDTLKESITGTNKAAEMSAQMTDNMKGAWDEFTSAAEEAGISVGNLLLPVLTDTIKMATGFVSSMTDAGKSVYGFYESFQASTSEWDAALLDFFGIEKMEPAAANAGEVSAKVLADNFQDNVPPEAFDQLDTNLTKAAGDAGANAGTEAAMKFENQFQEQAGMSNISSETLLGFINSQSTPDSKIQEYAFKVHDTMVKYWYDAEEKYPVFNLSLDDKIVSKQTAQAEKMYYSPEEMLRSIGMPVPDEGTVDWYRMKGNEAQAKILEAQKSFSQDNLWDVSYTPENHAKWRDANVEAIENIPGELASALYNAGVSVEESGNATLGESLNNVMKALGEPGKVDQTILNRSLSGLVDAGIIAPEWQAEIQRAATDATSADFIIDKDRAFQTKFSELGELAGKSLSDGIITSTEQDTMMAFVSKMEDMGYKGGDALADAIKNKDWNAVGQQTGEETGTAFAAALEASISGKTLDLAKYNISNPERFMEYQNEQLISSLKQFYEKGMYPTQETSPDTYKELVSIRDVLQAQYDKLTPMNQSIERALDAALNKGGANWETLYNLLRLNIESSTGSQKSGKSMLEQSNSVGQEIGVGFVNQMPRAGEFIIESGKQFSIQTDTAGRKWAVIGDAALRGGDSLYNAASAVNNAAGALNRVSVSCGGSGSGGSRGNNNQNSSNYRNGVRGYFDDPWMNINLKLPRYGEGGYVSGPRAAIVGDAPGGEFIMPAKQVEDLSDSINWLGSCVESAFGREQERKGAGLFYSDSASIDRKEWAAVYDDRGTCIAYVPPSDTLNYTPGQRNQGYIGPTSGWQAQNYAGVSTSGAKESSFRVWEPMTEQMSRLGETVQEFGNIAKSVVGGKYAIGGSAARISSPLEQFMMTNANQFTPMFAGGQQQGQGMYQSATGAAGQWAEQSRNLLQYTAEGISDSLYDCECAISDFAKAQETATGLFQESYIGPTAGWAGPGMGARMGGPGIMYSLPAVFNQGYNNNPWSASYSTGYNYGSGSYNYGNIGRSAIGGSLGGGISIGSFMAGSRSYGNIGSSIIGGIWSRFANEGFAPVPTAAIIGDRPGGEYVVGKDRLDRIESSIRGGSGRAISVTYNPTIQINGSGLGAAELEAVIEKSVSKSVAIITEKIDEASRGY